MIKEEIQKGKNKGKEKKIKGEIGDKGQREMRTYENKKNM